ncbi:MAG: sensor histidine kinase, partial [Syntrophothermus sp.]
TGMLSSIYRVNKGKIKINLDLEEQFLLIDYAIPCGLIINEIISNTFKYAFPGDMQGNLDIRMLRDQNRRILLQFKDDGVGLPAGFDHNNTSTLGMQLLTSLVGHQLNGELNIKSENGVCIEIRFNDDQYKERV